MIKAVLFDVDDTIYDHLLPFKKAVYDYTSHIQHFPYEEAYQKMRYYSDLLSIKYGGASKMESDGTADNMQAERFQLALEEYQVKVSFSQAQNIQKLYKSVQFHISPFEGIEDLIKELQSRQIVVGILTNGAQQHQWKKIEALQLNQWIPKSHIFVSGQYGWDKPDAKIFHYINEQLLLLPNECLYIGDSWRNDVIGAKNAGWNMIWFNHRAQQQGKDNIDKVTEARSIAELVEAVQQSLRLDK